MKSAIVIFFDKGGMPVDCKLACHKSKEPELENMARRMVQVAIEGRNSIERYPALARQKYKK